MEGSLGCGLGRVACSGVQAREAVMGNRIFGRELDGALERRDGSGQVALCFEDAPELDVDIRDFGI